MLDCARELPLEGLPPVPCRLERLEQFARAARQQATVSRGGSPRLPAAHVASGGAGSGASGSGGGLPGLGGFASLMQLGLPPLGPEAGLSAVASVGLDGDCPQVRGCCMGLLGQKSVSKVEKSQVDCCAQPRLLVMTVGEFLTLMKGGMEVLLQPRSYSISYLPEF